MAFSSPYTLEMRQKVEALLHRRDLTMTQIARSTGVSYDSVKLWNRQARIRPWTRSGRLEADPRTWTQGRLRAASRLFERGDIDSGDLAEALGCRRGDAKALMLACSLAASATSWTIDLTEEAPDLARLGGALRAHIARQIADFDERLRRADAVTDTAKVLRDLGGLKRLLDDLSAGARQSVADGDTDGELPQDLAALREDLARRYEAFEAGRHDAGLPGEPAAGAADGAGA